MDNTLGILIVATGLTVVFGMIGWNVWGGLRLKRQVDRDYEELRAINRARDVSVLSNSTR